jgi:type VI secretion system FHA domain protein
MILTLEVCGQQAANLGAACRKEFHSTGGIIGRLPDNDWVLPGGYVSGRHARIQFRSGQFFVEDTSTNGVFVDSPENRLQRGQPYPLKGGERLFIDDYEIQVAVMPDEREPKPLRPAASTSSRDAPLIPDDPFSVDAVDRGSAVGVGVRVALRNSFAGAAEPFGTSNSDEADPLKVLGIETPKRAAIPRAPRATDLAAGSLLSDHYSPPVVRQPESTEPLIFPEELDGEGPKPRQGKSSALIPADYDPLAPEDASVVPPVMPPARPTPRPRSEAPVADPARPAPGPPRSRAAATPRQAAPPTPTPTRGQSAGPARAASSSQVQASVRASPDSQRQSGADPFAAIVRRDDVLRSQSAQAPAQQAEPPRSAATAASGHDFDFQAFLQGAGVQGVDVSPELAKNLGQILRVVISGVMDILRAREQIKEEFRLRTTVFKATDNNPLKFSANVEDALHNLLVRRNTAYLGPREAFEDAFRDVRNHQMAMLAGVRVAYQAMLAQFDPQRLQADFDRQLKKGAFLGAPARLKYWDLYGERFRGRVRDEDSCFRDLFGDEFAKAYEEQLARLRTLERSGDK